VSDNKKTQWVNLFWICADRLRDAAKTPFGKKSDESSRNY